jgi:amino acid adenylation domain-containing protein
VAIKSVDQSISYLDLERKSNRIANFMHGKIKETPHVILILDRSPQLIESIIGLLKCGLVFVPLTPSFPVSRVKKMIEETRAQWVITTENYYEKFRDIFKGDGKGTNIKALIIDGDGNGARNTSFLGPDIESNCLAFERVSNKNCYIYFTSGSTGTPKCVLGRQKSLAHFIHWEIKEFGVNEGFNVSQFTPPAFDPFLRDIFLPLMAGAACCIPSHDTLMNMRKLIRWIDENNITLIHTVPSLFKKLADQIQDSTCFQNLKYILLAGELLRGRDISRFIEIFNHRIQLVNVYGPTETTLAKLFYPIKPEDMNRTIIPVGKPIDGAQVLILDYKKQKCRKGKKGEIYIRTPFISSGYYNDPGLTKKVFIKNPYGKHPKDIIYKTGDLGRLLPDGNIELSGRVDSQVKVRGIRIELGEIENQLLKYDDVKEAVVTAKDDENGNKYLCAYVVSAPGKKLETPVLRRYLYSHLPDYMVPSYFVFLEKIPLSSNGKIDRTRLPVPKESGLSREINYTAPKNITEKRIAAVWQEVLQLEKIGVNNNFFDLGGDSLKMMEVSSQLSKEFKKEIPIAKLFEHTTISALAQYLDSPVVDQEVPDEALKLKGPRQRVEGKNGIKQSGEVAVIGMSCRFPGARGIDEFRDNLMAGVESISFSSHEELSNLGVESKFLNNPNHVNAVSTLPGKEYFDAAFFDYTPKEAELLDPQIRLFHECAWEALEDGGIVPDSFAGKIGVYAGAVQNLDWESRVLLSGKGRSFGEFAASKLSGIRYLCTRLSYSLNLNGPSVTMQTACSTSLVAIHMAWQSLLNRECHVAIAGGVTLSPKKKSHYVYEEGMVYSADGHCRSFDARANGIIFGEGAGVVLLKPLQTAIENGDHIYAVIKGSAINNDGNRKVGFTAPSVKGQVEVILAALDIAGIEPRSIGYIEAHGTATTLGDPIEIEALTQVFNIHKKKSCKIGSVKSNFGHLDAAAGVAGFIKTVLSLKHRMIPPSLHFETPNPEINLEDSPFEVNTRLIQWKKENHPRRAGVTSLGMGGTNAHVILEEAPQRKQSSGSRNYHMILLSAKSENSLNIGAKNLADFLKNNNDIKLADAAYTLQTRRKRFNYRRMFTCSGTDEAIGALFLSPDENSLTGSPDNCRVYNCTSTGENTPVIFMFSGQGSQYVNMGLDLYIHEPVFREEVDRCIHILEKMGCHIKDILYPDEAESGLSLEDTKRKMDDVIYSGPIKFTIEYALGKLLMKWGVKPYAMIGHSFGEFMAAQLAGVFSLEDALSLVVLRGKLMEKMPPGAMMSVSLPEETLKPLLKEDISLAAVNTPSHCIVSGPTAAMDTFEKELTAVGHDCLLLNFPRASHSKMMKPICEEFEKHVRKAKLNEPKIPYISGLTGDWTPGAQAKDPAYWSRHMVETIRFTDGVKKLLEKPDAIFVQVGSDRGLPLFVSKNRQGKSEDLRINLLRNQKEKVSDVYYLLNSLGLLWLHGGNWNWSEFYSHERRNFIPLPTYSFDRKYYWIDPVDTRDYNSKAKVIRKEDIADWFYIPSWKRSVLLPGDKIKPENNYNLVFSDRCGFSTGLLDRLKQNSGKIIEVIMGTGFQKISELSYVINPESEEDYEKLFRELCKFHQLPARVIHLWGITDDGKQRLTKEKVRNAQNSGYYSLINIARAIGNVAPYNKIQMIIITDNMQCVNGTETTDPGKSTILGPVQVIPQEYSNVTCRSIDILWPAHDEAARHTLFNQIYQEIFHRSLDKMIAYRGSERWVYILEPVKLPRLREVPKILEPNSVYLITGGLGGIGLALAGYLSKTVQPTLILTGRSHLPGKEEWDNWLEQHNADEKISKKIRMLKSIEENGSEVLYLKADAANLQEMAAVIKTAEARLGEIKGIIHTAGIVDRAGVIHKRTWEENENVFKPKLDGTMVLNHLFEDRKLDFFILCSSMSSVCAHYGQVGYSSGNAFLDAFAGYKTRKGENFTLSISWDSWFGVGMGAGTLEEKFKKGKIGLEHGFLAEEAIETFIRAIDHNFSHLAVTPVDIYTRIDLHQVKEKSIENENHKDETSSTSRAPVIDLSTPSFKSLKIIEKRLTEIWKEFLGYDMISKDDNFFEIGGDSLTAMEVRKRINEIFNINIPVVDIFHYSTIGLLAKKLIKQEESEEGEAGQEEENNHNVVEESLTEVLEKFGGI